VEQSVTHQNGGRFQAEPAIGAFRYAPHTPRPEAQKSQMKILAEKAQSGERTDSEKEEAESYGPISSLLGMLQSKARLTLRDADQ